jgi:hypothetical protein
MKGSEIAINSSVFTPDGEPTMGYQKDGAGVYTYITGTYNGPNTQLNGKKLKVQVMHLDPVHSARKLNESGNDLPWDKVDATKADKYSNPTPYVFVEPGQSENVAQAPKPEPPFSPEEVRSRISAAESTGSNSNKAYAVATEAQEFSNRGMNDESLRAFGKALEYADKIEDEKERIKVRRNIEAAKGNIMQQNRNRVSGSSTTNAAPQVNTPESRMNKIDSTFNSNIDKL